MKENPVPALGQPPARTGCTDGLATCGVDPCLPGRVQLRCDRGVAQQHTDRLPLLPGKGFRPGQQPLVALEQLARRPERGARQGRPDNLREQRHLGRHGGHTGGARCLRERPEQRVHGGPVRRRAHQRDHGQAKSRRQRNGIHSPALLLRNVGHVERNDHRQAERHQLGHDIQAPFHARRVDHGEHGVGSAGKQVVAGNFLFRRMRGHPVAAGQIHEGKGHAIPKGRAFLAIHGLPRPVAHTLVQPGQPVEQCRLPGVGLARHRDSQGFPRRMIP